MQKTWFYGVVYGVLALAVLGASLWAVGMVRPAVRPGNSPALSAPTQAPQSLYPASKGSAVHKVSSPTGKAYYDIKGTFTSDLTIGSGTLTGTFVIADDPTATPVSVVVHTDGGTGSLALFPKSLDDDAVAQSVSVATFVQYVKKGTPSLLLVGIGFPNSGSPVEGVLDGYINGSPSLLSGLTLEPITVGVVKK